MEVFIKATLSMVEKVAVVPSRQKMATYTQEVLKTVKNMEKAN